LILTLLHADESCRIGERTLIAADVAVPLIVGHAYRDDAVAEAAAAVVGAEVDRVHPTVTRTGPLDTNLRHAGPDAHRIRTRGAAAFGIARLVLADAGDRDGDGVAVGIGHADHVHRREAVIGRPEQRGRGLRAGAVRRLVERTELEMIRLDRPAAP